MKSKNNIFKLIYSLINNIDDKLYLGIGIGAISTEKKEVAVGMDGPAFHRARKALKKTKKAGKKLYYLENNEQLSKYISIILLLAIDIINNLTVKQLKAIQLKQKGLTQQEIADWLNISRTAVTSRLARADFKTIFHIENLLNQMVFNI